MNQDCPECDVADVLGKSQEDEFFVFTCPECECVWDEDGEIIEHGRRSQKEPDDMSRAKEAMENEGMYGSS